MFLFLVNISDRAQALLSMLSQCCTIELLLIHGFCICELTYWLKLIAALTFQWCVYGHLQTCPMRLKILLCEVCTFLGKFEQREVCKQVAFVWFIRGPTLHIL